MKPGWQTQVELAMHTPPLAQGVEQLELCRLRTLTPPLPPTMLPTLATLSHATTRLPDEPPTLSTALMLLERRKESISVEFEMAPVQVESAV